MNRQTYIYELCFIILAVILINSCSSTARYQILSTFFDGVPNPNKKKPDNSKTDGVDSLLATKDITPIQKESEFFYHPPYQNRMCDGCHNMQRGNELIQSIPDLCYKCHENITELNPALHGPVAMGDCNVCHTPHLGKNKFLLVRKGRDLCLYCHEATYIYENKNHFATEELSCLDCHDPHSGKDRFLLN